MDTIRTLMIGFTRSCPEARGCLPLSTLRKRRLKATDPLGRLRGEFRRVTGRSMDAKKTTRMGLRDYGEVKRHLRGQAT